MPLASLDIIRAAKLGFAVVSHRDEGRPTHYSLTKTYCSDEECYSTALLVSPTAELLRTEHYKLDSLDGILTGMTKVDRLPQKIAGEYNLDIAQLLNIP